MNRLDPDTKRNENRLFSAVFLFWFSVYTYPSFLTSYAVNTLHATNVLAGMIVGSYGLTQMILRIPLGILSDVLKRRKPFVMMGFGLSIAASGGLALVDILAGREIVPEGLALAALFCRGVSGMTAAAWVNLSVLYSSNYHGEDLAPAMSRLIVPQCGSQIIAMLLGAQLAGRLGELYAFLLATAAGVAGLLVMARIQETRPTGEPMTIRALAVVIRNRQLVQGTVLATVYQLVVWATAQGFVQNWARDVIGMTTAELGFLSVANLLPNTILSRFSGTVFAPRFGRKTVLGAGFGFLAAACCFYPQTDSMWSLMGAQALLGCGVGLIMPLTMASAIETVPENRRGAAMGIYQAIYGLGMFAGPVIAGWVIEGFSKASAGEETIRPGYTANFYAMAAIAVIGGILAVLLTQGRRRQSK
ncbi:MAG: MFS transporter [Clostridia bacterium]|nr:MFS transporter [Clostridia bacterium]